jgi:ketosteroid isomerase-like protein
MVESWLEVTTQWRATPCEVVACSDGVVAEFVVSARGLATGIPTTVHGWAVLRVRDGLIANWREFTDRDAAIREAAQPLGAR